MNGKRVWIERDAEVAFWKLIEQHEILQENLRKRNGILLRLRNIFWKDDGAERLADIEISARRLVAEFSLPLGTDVTQPGSGEAEAPSGAIAA